MFSLKKVSLLTASLLGAMAIAQPALAHSGHDHSGQAAHHHTSHHSASHKESAVKLEVSNCWGRLNNEQHPSALYVNFKNTEDIPAYVVGIKSSHFEKTVLHESYEEDGMMGMRHVPEVEIPAKGAVEFKPGGYHYMLYKPSNVKQGDKIPFTFLLSNGHELSAECVMKSPKSRSFND
ncbi:copper chaperone PCu(A)C [Pelistega ratti]|nr:copper chaperone PCu(A)C [Pelistega ratti]